MIYTTPLNDLSILLSGALQSARTRSNIDKHSHHRNNTETQIGRSPRYVKTNELRGSDENSVYNFATRVVVIEKNRSRLYCNGIRKRVGIGSFFRHLSQLANIII